MTTGLKHPINIAIRRPSKTPSVFLAASFTDPAWEPVELKAELVSSKGTSAIEDGSPHVEEYEFSRQFEISEGKHQYKFRLGTDETSWFCNENLETVVDEHGNTNNFLLVTSSSLTDTETPKREPIITDTDNAAHKSTVEERETEVKSKQDVSTETKTVDKVNDKEASVDNGEKALQEVKTLDDTAGEEIVSENTENLTPIEAAELMQEAAVLAKSKGPIVDQSEVVIDAELTPDVLPIVADIPTVADDEGGVEQVQESSTDIQSENVASETAEELPKPLEEPKEVVSKAEITAVSKDESPEKMEVKNASDLVPVEGENVIGDVVSDAQVTVEEPKVPVPETTEVQEPEIQQVACKSTADEDIASKKLDSVPVGLKDEIKADDQVPAFATEVRSITIEEPKKDETASSVPDIEEGEPSNVAAEKPTAEKPVVQSAELESGNTDDTETPNTSKESEKLIVETQELSEEPKLTPVNAEGESLSNVVNEPIPVTGISKDEQMIPENVDSQDVRDTMNQGDHKTPAPEETKATLEDSAKEEPVTAPESAPTAVGDPPLEEIPKSEVGQSEAEKDVLVTQPDTEGTIDAEAPAPAAPTSTEAPDNANPEKEVSESQPIELVATDAEVEKETSVPEADMVPEIKKEETPVEVEEMPILVDSKSVEVPESTEISKDVGDTEIVESTSVQPEVNKETSMPEPDSVTDTRKEETSVNFEKPATVTSEPIAEESEANQTLKEEPASEKCVDPATVKPEAVEEEISTKTEENDTTGPESTAEEQDPSQDKIASKEAIEPGSPMEIDAQETPVIESKFTTAATEDEAPIKDTPEDQGVVLEKSEHALGDVVCEKALQSISTESETVEEKPSSGVDAPEETKEEADIVPEEPIVTLPEAITGESKDTEAFTGDKAAEEEISSDKVLETPVTNLETSTAEPKQDNFKVDSVEEAEDEKEPLSTEEKPSKEPELASAPIAAMPEPCTDDEVTFQNVAATLTSKGTDEVVSKVEPAESEPKDNEALDATKTSLTKEPGIQEPEAVPLDAVSSPVVSKEECSDITETPVMEASNTTAEEMAEGKPEHVEDKSEINPEDAEPKPVTLVVEPTTKLSTEENSLPPGKLHAEATQEEVVALASEGVTEATKENISCDNTNDAIKAIEQDTVQSPFVTEAAKDEVADKNTEVSLQAPEDRKNDFAIVKDEKAAEERPKGTVEFNSATSAPADEESHALEAVHNGPDHDEIQSCEAPEPEAVETTELQKEENTSEEQPSENEQPQDLQGPTVSLGDGTDLAREEVTTEEVPKLDEPEDPLREEAEDIPQAALIEAGAEKKEPLGNASDLLDKSEASKSHEIENGATTVTDNDLTLPEQQLDNAGREVVAEVTETQALETSIPTDAKQEVPDIDGDNIKATSEQVPETLPGTAEKFPEETITRDTEPHEEMEKEISNTPEVSTLAAMDEIKNVKSQQVEAKAPDFDLSPTLAPQDSKNEIDEANEDKATTFEPLVDEESKDIKEVIDPESNATGHSKEEAVVDTADTHGKSNEKSAEINPPTATEPPSALAQPDAAKERFVETDNLTDVQDGETSEQVVESVCEQAKEQSTDEEGQKSIAINQTQIDGTSDEATAADQVPTTAPPVDLEIECQEKKHLAEETPNEIVAFVDSTTSQVVDEPSKEPATEALEGPREPESGQHSEEVHDVSTAGLEATREGEVKSQESALAEAPVIESEVLKREDNGDVVGATEIAPEVEDAADADVMVTEIADEPKSDAKQKSVIVEETPAVEVEQLQVKQAEVEGAAAGSLPADSPPIPKAKLTTDEVPREDVLEQAPEAKDTTESDVTTVPVERLTEPVAAEAQKEEIVAISDAVEEPCSKEIEEISVPSTETPEVANINDINDEGVVDVPAPVGTEKGENSETAILSKDTPEFHDEVAKEEASEPLPATVDSERKPSAIDAEDVQDAIPAEDLMKKATIGEEDEPKGDSLDVPTDTVHNANLPTHLQSTEAKSDYVVEDIEVAPASTEGPVVSDSKESASIFETNGTALAAAALGAAVVIPAAALGAAVTITKSDATDSKPVLNNTSETRDNAKLSASEGQASFEASLHNDDTKTDNKMASVENVAACKNEAIADSSQVTPTSTEKSVVAENLSSAGPHGEEIPPTKDIQEAHVAAPNSTSQTVESNPKRAIIEDAVNETSKSPLKSTETPASSSADPSAAKTTTNGATTNGAKTNGTSEEARPATGNRSVSSFTAHRKDNFLKFIWRAIFVNFFGSIFGFRRRSTTGQ